MTDRRASRSYKEIAITFAPAVFLVIAGFWFAARFVSPAPPKHIIIATGMENGAYYRYAEKYRDELAKEDISVEIITSNGSKNNIALLLENKADIAFVQGGTGNPDDALVSLGSLYYEPVWIFINRQVSAKNLADFIGLHVAIGPAGSGTQLVSKQLLERNQVTRENSGLLPLSGMQAADSLSKHQIDAAIFVSSAEAKAIQTLLHDPKVMLFNLYRADAYALPVQGDTARGHYRPAQQYSPASSQYACTSGKSCRKRRLPFGIDRALSARSKKNSQRCESVSPTRHISGVAADCLPAQRSRRTFLQGWSTVPDALPAFLGRNLYRPHDGFPDPATGPDVSVVQGHATALPLAGKIKNLSLV